MKVKPLGWIPSIILFLIAASILLAFHYYFAPAYTLATGKPYLVGYLIGWISPMFLVFLASLFVYRIDGHPITKDAFIQRYRLHRLGMKDWGWTLAMVVVSVGSLAALSFTADLLKSVSLFSPPPLYPPDLIDPTTHLTKGVLFEMPLSGKWWLIIVYLIGWFLNIVGEEFWYRGWMLPRHEVAFGKYSWIVNGLMFNFQHIYLPWNLLAMLPGSLFVSYAVQRQQKTWTSIIWHGFVNFSLFIFIIQGVIG
jgi:membrane protease YdiL (CAAX protease family)